MTRTHRGAHAPGGLARRCTAFCAAPPGNWRKVRESNPQELSLRQFSGLRGVPMPNLPRDASGGTRTPMLAKSDSFTGCCLTSSASDADEKLMKAESGKLSPPSSPQGNSVVK